ncbi:MAG: hypothetical protein OQL09_04445 [Gammaproteobacteria bacterium]|nr:hypothetical protein [Gammaproteobacteria bacterium]
MYISKIYLMFTLEFLLILLAICASLVIYIIKRPATAKNKDVATESAVITETSYSAHLEKEILRNEAKIEQQTHSEKEDTTDTASPTDEKQSQLLKLRDMFLKTEHSSAAHTENEITFWDTLYSGLKEIHLKFKTVEKEIVTDTEHLHIKTENSSEKVFYIETQGKKVDSEINRLKDIIFDQDNTLNSLKHALDGASSHISDDNEAFSAIRNEIAKFEQQLNDSKMCMEVLEMENDRLQTEIDQLEHQLETQSDISMGDPTVLSGNINQLKDTLNSQEQQIDTLNQTIDSLKLDASQSETLKATIQSFTRGSKEMMDCITILEEDNENLHQLIEELKTQAEPTTTTSDIASEELTEKVKALEKQIIKKDVAYAKLQDEYTSIEKEYMSLYEQIHGND